MANNPPKEQPRRRVSDTNYAAQLQDVRHAQQLLEKDVAQSMQSMRSSLDTIQLDQRAATAALQSLARLQDARDADREAIAGLRVDLAGISSRLESYFDDAERRHDERWRRYENNRDSWRREHEDQNKRDHEQNRQQIQTLREKFMWVAGGFSVVGTLGGVIVTMALWSYNKQIETQDASVNSRFNNTAESIRELRVTGSTNRESIHQIELYLARGGRTPSESYQSPNERKESNVQQQPQRNAR